jgi:hypothetical protein
MSKAARNESTHAATPDTRDRGVHRPERNVPGPNDLARALFAGEHGTEAYRVPVDDGTIYLLPWACSGGGLAAFRESTTPGDAWPIEVPPDRVRQLVDGRGGGYVDLDVTPVWVLDDRRHPLRVSWHARTRYAERFDRCAEPAYAIRDAWRSSVPVGTPEGPGRFHPPTGMLIATADDGAGWVAKTVIATDTLDGFTDDHLPVCHRCELRYHQQIRRDRASCPWCGTPDPQRA